MQGSLQFIRESSPEQIQAKHTVFVESVRPIPELHQFSSTLLLRGVQEESVDEFDAEEYFETPKPLLTRSYNRPSKETLESGDILVNGEHLSAKELAKIEKQKRKSYEELAARMSRQKKIQRNLQSVQLKRALSVRPGSAVGTSELSNVSDFIPCRKTEM